MRSFAKSFAVAVVAGGLLALVSVAVGSPTRSLVASSAAFVALITVALGTLDWAARRKLGPGARSAAPRQERVLTLPIPPEDAHALCRRVLEEGPVTRVVSDDPGAGRLEVRTAMSANSWGEVVEIVVAGGGPGSSVVHVTSRPAFRFAFLDGGRGWKNAETITSSLRDWTGTTHQPD